MSEREVYANWVEKCGGLPQYIKRISKHLRAKGMTESHAIATAVNVVKKMCATGDINYPGAQQVNPASRAEACADVAKWEALKKCAQTLAADTDDSVCIVALPEEASEVHELGPEEKHATLLYLGKMADSERLADSRLLLASVTKIAAAEVEPFSVAVENVEPLGDADPPAQVWMLDKSSPLGKIREALFDIDSEVSSLYEDADITKYPEYTPHVTIGYGSPNVGTDEAREKGLVSDDNLDEARQIKAITFDRLALWWGDERTEYPMGKTSTTDSADIETEMLELAWTTRPPQQLEDDDESPGEEPPREGEKAAVEDDDEEDESPGDDDPDDEEFSALDDSDFRMIAQFATAEQDLPKDATGPPWEGMILPFDTDAVDGRMFSGEIIAKHLPLHLRWVGQDVGEHKGAVTVGRILEVENRPDGVYAKGDLFHPGQFSGWHADAIRSATNFMKLKLGQISADVMARHEMRGNRRVAVDGILMGATMVSLPAFQEARTRLAAAALEIPLAEGTSMFGDDLAPAQLLGYAAEDCADGLCDIARLAYSVTGSAGLPIGPAKAWDGPGAAGRMLEQATTDGKIDRSKASRGFFWVEGKGENRGDYKLPFADVVDDELVVIPAALSAVLSRLDSTDGPSDTDKAAIRTKVTAYQAKARSAEKAAALMARVAYSVTGDISLPIVERGAPPDKGWDGGKAVSQLFEWATDDSGEVDVDRLAKAFLYRDPSKNPQAKWAWSIPIAVPIGGSLQIVPEAVFQASTIVNGGRAPVKIPSAELSRIQGKVAKLYRRMNRKPPGDRDNRRAVELIDEKTAVQCSDCEARISRIMDVELEALSATLDREVLGAQSEGE